MAKTNLIEYISGGNHELFHSNLLAYIAQNYPDFFREIFKGHKKIYDALKKYDWSDLVAVREENNFDLAIKSKEADKKGRHYILVLENKMKSLPDTKQLSDYQKKATADCRVLLTMVKSADEEITNGWEQVTYTELTSQIEHLLTECLKGKNDFGIDSFFFNFLQQYVSYLREISNEVKTIEKSFEDQYDTQPITDFFRADKNTDSRSNSEKWKNIFFRKLRFQLVAEKIKEGLSKEYYFKVGIVRSAVPFIEVAPYTASVFNEKKNKYWMQIYDNHVERGFWLYHDTITDPEFKSIEKPGKRNTEKRETFFSLIWKSCMSIPEFEKINDTLAKEPYNAEVFNGNIEEKSKLFRGYIYNDYTLVDLQSPLEDMSIKQFVDMVIQEMKGIKHIILETEKKENQQNTNQNQ